MTDQSTSNPFLLEVIANPEEDDARLVYADWLEEQGDPRGEFIRAQCEEASSDETEIAYYDALVLADRLLAQYAEQWAGELAQDVKKAQFRRGFVDEVTVLASALLKDNGAIFGKAPFQWLRLNRVKGKGRPLAELEALTVLRGLDVSGIKVPTDDMQAILGSPHLTNLKRFRSRHYATFFTRSETRALVDSVAAQSLAHLELNYDESLQGLARRGGFPELQTLKIESYSTEIFEQDLTELALPSLTKLQLHSLHCNRNSVRHLVKIPWASLEHLELTCADERDVIQQLMHLGVFENLKTLKLSVHSLCEPDLIRLLMDSNQLQNCESLEIEIRGRGITTTSNANEGPSYISELAQASQLQNLKRLAVSHLKPGDLQQLLSAPQLQQLRELHLSHAAFAQSDADALILSSARESLRKLRIVSSVLDEDFASTLSASQFPELLSLTFEWGFEQFERSFNFTPVMKLLERGSDAFPELRKLSLDWLGMHGEQLEQLSRSVQLPELRVLSFQHNHCSQTSAKSIIDSGAFPKLAQFRVQGSLKTKNIEKLNQKFDHVLKLNNFSNE